MVKQSNGSTVLYEISTAAGEDITDNEEMKKTENISSSYVIDVKKYSAFNEQIHTTAWINRFINNLQSDGKKKGPLLKEEIEKAKLSCVKHIQKNKLLVKGQRW